MLPLIAAWVFQPVLTFPPEKGVMTSSDPEDPQVVYSLLYHQLLNENPESKYIYESSILSYT